MDLVLHGGDFKVILLPEEGVAILPKTLAHISQIIRCHITKGRNF
jgi:hypothetical protein